MLIGDRAIHPYRNPMLFVHAPRSLLSFQGKNTRRVRGSKKSLDNKINHTQKKNDNSKLVDAMHYFGVEIGNPVRVFLSKEISADLSKRKELF